MTSAASHLTPLIDQFLNYLLVEKGLSRATLESYSSDLLRYADFLEQNGRNTVSVEDTALILKHLINLRAEGLGRVRAQGIWCPFAGSIAFYPMKRFCRLTRRDTSTCPRPLLSCRTCSASPRSSVF